MLVQAYTTFFERNPFKLVVLETAARHGVHAEYLGRGAGISSFKVTGDKTKLRRFAMTMGLAFGCTISGEE